MGILPIVGGLVLCCGAPVGYGMYVTSAPPLQNLQPFLETDPTIASQLGAPVQVSMWVTKRLERNYYFDEKRDLVMLLTWIQGESRTCWLDADAENYDGQGWSGSWRVFCDGETVLINGEYQTQGAGTLMEGTFDLDGQVLVSP